MPEGDDFNHEFAELLEDRFLLGSPAEVADQLNRLHHDWASTISSPRSIGPACRTVWHWNNCTCCRRRCVRCCNPEPLWRKQNAQDTDLRPLRRNPLRPDDAEQQEGYRAMMETRGGLPGPSKIWIHNPKLAKVAGPFGGHFHAGHYSLTERERSRCLRHHQPLPFRLPNGGA